MKVSNSCLCAALSLFIFISCTKEESTKDYSISNASEIITNFNVGKLKHQQGEYLEGEVYIRAASDNRIVAFVTGKENATIVYQLQTTGWSNSKFQTTIKKAQILFFHDNVIINSTTEDESYRFGLASKKDPLIKVSSETKGFGLARYTLASNQLANQRSDEAAFGGPGDPPPVESCSCVFLTGADDCDSGGIGSTGCSGNYGENGSYCSVTCEGGDTQYYACCNTE